MHSATRPILTTTALVTILSTGVLTAQTDVDATWNGSFNTDWSNFVNWDFIPSPVPLAAPTNNVNYHYDVAIGAAAVTLNQIATIDSISIASGGMLTMENGRSLSLATAGSANNGTLVLSAAISNVTLTFQAAGTLNGTGSIQLSDSQNNRIASSGVAVTLGSGQTLTGAGKLLLNSGGLVNSGSITATGTNPLTIDPGTGFNFTNSGTLSAQGAGGLVLAGGDHINTGSTIDVQSGSRLTLANNVVLTGGTLATSGSGVVEVTSSISTIDGVTLNGSLDVPNGRSLTVLNNLANHGRIDLGANLSTSTLTFNSTDQTLSGSGLVVLTDAANNRILTPGQTLTLGAGQQLSGAGQLLANGGGMINNGSITASGTIPLTIDPATTFSFANLGSLTASGSGGLSLNAGDYQNSGHVIDVLDGSKLALNTGCIITGGTLQTTGSGQVETSSTNQTLDGVTLEGSLLVPNGDTLTILNNLINNGRIDLGAALSNSTLTFTSSSQTLSGSGLVVLTDAATNRILTPSQTLTLGADQQLSGAGQLLANGGGMINQGSITATGTIPLTIDPASSLSFTNLGTLVASGAGGLVFNGGDYQNTGHVIEVLDGSRLLLNTGTLITGGTLQTTGSGQVETSSTSQTLDGVTLEGSLLVPNGDSLTILNNLVNNGRIDLGAAASNSTLTFTSSDQTLSGTGLIVLTDAANNRILTPSQTLTLGSGQQLSGAGQLLLNGGGMINQGSITATGTIALTIDPAPTLPFTNLGTLVASGLGGLVFNSGDYQNTGQVIEVLDGSRLLLNSGSLITGGTLQTTGSGRVEAGSTSQTLDAVTLNGTLDVPNARAMTVTNGLTNDGTITLGAALSTSTLTFIAADQTIAGSGTIELSDSATNRILTSGFDLTNGPSHTIRGSGQLLLNSGGLINQGTLIADQTKTMNIDPAAASSLINQGTMTCSGVGSFLIGAAALVENSASGRIDGNGTLDLTTNTLQNHGLITPTLAGAPTQLSVDGNITNSASAKLAVTISGTTQGSGYSHLDVVGNLVLGGLLEVHLSGFLPSPVDTFTIATATTISGIFSNPGALVTANTGNVFIISTSPTAVILTPTALTTAGTPYQWLESTGLVAPGSDPAVYEAADIADFDGDGQTAADEFVAGTDPKNFSSRLSLTLDPDNGDPATLDARWPSVAGRSYLLHHSPDIATPFTPYGSPFSATPPLNLTEIPMSLGPRSFFQLSVSFE